MFFKRNNILDIIYLRIMLVCVALLALSSCRSKQAASAVAGGGAPSYTVSEAKVPLVVGGQRALPKAVIYRTNGDYADNVAVTLNADRNGLLSYPAPIDIADSSAPLKLDDGWWLDRRGGIGANTAFLKYTYAEYRGLQHVDAAMLMDAILPDARVTEVRTLPVNASEAIANPDIVNRYIKQ